MLSKIYSLMNSGTVLSLFLQVVTITVLVGIVYAVCRYITVKRRSITTSLGRESMRCLFVCYLTGLVNLVLVPANLWMLIWANICIGYSHSELKFFSGEFNLVPIVIELLLGEMTLGRWVITMLVYNFLMFMPFGFFLPFVSDKVTFSSALKVAVVVPVVVEVIQPIVGRSFDVDDIILNFAGIIAGYLAAVLIKSMINKRKATAHAAPDR